VGKNVIDARIGRKYCVLYIGYIFRQEHKYCVLYIGYIFRQEHKLQLLDDVRLTVTLKGPVEQDICEHKSVTLSKIWVP